MIRLWPTCWRRKAFPHFAFYSPDVCNNGHGMKGKCEFTADAPWATRLEAATKWLHDFLDPLLDEQNHPEFNGFRKGTLIIITFDESASDYTGDNQPTNRIYTVFLGPMVRKGAISYVPTNHYNVLRTIEDNFDLGTLGEEDARNGPIADVWND